MKIDQEYIKNLPTKYMASAVLFFNKKGELLIIKPNYREHWSVPGGVIEEHESPINGAIRETREEIGLTKKNLKLLVIDHKDCPVKGESLQIIFSGGILSDSDIKKIKIGEDEIEDFMFCDVKKGLSMLDLNLSKRAKFGILAIKNNNQYFLENGELI